MASAAAEAEYRFSLILLNELFQPAGKGTFEGHGQEVRIGPVAQEWQVSGTLGLDSLGEVVISGWGAEYFWTANGMLGSAAATIAMVPQTFVNAPGGTSDGTITVGDTTWFFVGTTLPG